MLAEINRQNNILIQIENQIREQNIKISAQEKQIEQIKSPAKQLDHGPSIQIVLRHLAETQGKPRDSLGGTTGKLRQLLLKQLEQVRLRSMGM